jgi:hypothetical protein
MKLAPSKKRLGRNLKYLGPRARKVFNVLYQAGLWLGVFAIAFVVWSVPAMFIAFIILLITGLDSPVVFWISYGLVFVGLVWWMLVESYHRAYAREFSARTDQEPLSRYHPDNFLWRLSSRRAKLDEKFWKRIRKDTGKTGPGSRGSPS